MGILDPEIAEKIEWLEEKSCGPGQDLESYLETGEDIFALEEFEIQYPKKNFVSANNLKDNSLYDKYENLSIEERNNNKLIGALRSLDIAVHVK